MSKKKTTERLEKSFGRMKDDEYYFELIEKYFRNKDHSGSFQVVSDKTCNDLDFEELFMFLDRTSSKVGQQYLYNKLRSIPSGTENQEVKEKIIRKFTEEPEFRMNVQKQLERINKFDAYYVTSLFQEEPTPPPKWYFVIPLLSFASLLSLILIPFNPNMLIVFTGILITNLAIHYWNKRNLYAYVDSIPQLLRLNGLASKLQKEPIFEELNPKLKESVKIIYQIRKRMSFFDLETRLKSDFEAFLWFGVEIFKVVFLLEPLFLFGVLKRLDSKRKQIEEVYCFVGEIDSLLSVASLRHGLDRFCVPTIDKSDISVQKIYHPLIPDCMTNDINISNHSILLTGSNMSGKTSFIRTIGINMITGLTINTCFAESATIPRLQVHSAIRISDDLMNDKSYYFQEVLTIKEMLDKSSNDKPNLFLLDEIFKGTNTIERIAAGKAVLSKLAKNNNIVLVSTHDIELTEMLDKEYELFHFSEIVKEKNVAFDYKLKQGKLKNRNAIQILKINDYPDDVIHEATEITKKLDNITVDYTLN